MKKVLLLTLLFALMTTFGFSQTNRFWSPAKESASRITKDKAVGRLSFPKEFKLFDLSLASMRQELFTVVNNASRHSTVISLPNADGGMEEFEVFEASNFEPALQAQYPEIRAFSGKGITDKYATLKMSISPQGIQTMVFRTDKDNEFIEPYSQDHTVYAVFKSQRTAGSLPWSCSTADRHMVDGLNTQVANSVTARSGGDLKTMRLAQSVTAEYSNFFGATSAAQSGLVLAAVNNTLTRCNGVYEKDLALHLNLIANTTSVFYYTASSDPYSAGAAGAAGDWTSQLVTTLHNVIGDANFDIGHLFGASGGGGNAGCIGCICSNSTTINPDGSTNYKGGGYTSPADNIPQGDNFDIDYVVHEIGHQLGATHTFTYSSEGGSLSSSSQKEVGSGITIMGYAGITPQDVAPHSIDIYHAVSIAQIQANLAAKTCPTTTSITANNATPVVAAVSNYTIPKSTPFALTGSATDANAGDVLTYCWEQNDASTSATGSSSVASATKTAGPNWISFSPTTSPTRLFPKLATILNGALISGPLTGGDAGANTEALSSVARTLNFRLTVRDNCPYSSTAPIKVGQTSFTDMVVTVDATSGPFAVSVPNTAVSWAGGSIQTITWAVASTTAAPVSCANVKISLSTDGGQTFPTVLAASTPNDGTETLTIPNTATTTARIKIEAVGNIFFDISNTNFTITASSGLTTISTMAVSPTAYCAGTSVSVPFTTIGTANAGNVFTAQLSNSGGSFASPVSIGTLTSTTGGTIAATIPNTTAAGTGYRIRVVSSNPVVTGTDNGANITVVVPGNPSLTISANPGNAICAGTPVIFTATPVNQGTTPSYNWKVNGVSVSSGSQPGLSSFTISNLANGNIVTCDMSVVPQACLPAGAVVVSNSITMTVNAVPVAAITPSTPQTICSGSTVVLTATAGAGFSYQWRRGGSNIAGATNQAYTASIAGSYDVIITSPASCTDTSSAVAVTVTSSSPASVTIAANPSGAICQGTPVVFTATPVNGGSAPTYTWNVNGVVISTGTTNTYTNSSFTTAGAIVNCVMTSNLGGCVTNNPATSNTINVVVNPLPTATITATGSTTICQGGSVVLNANTGTGLTYQWLVSTAAPSGPWSNLGGSSGSSITVSPTVTTYYEVRVTNASGCSTISNPITVTVNPLPTVSYTGLASSYAVNAAAATLTGSPTGGTFSGPGISGNTFTPSAAGVGGPYTITYTYTNANNCTATSTHQTTVTGTCTVPNRPGTITTVGGTAKVCPGDVKTYTIVAVSGALNYTWTAPPGGTVTSGQGTTSATVTYNSGFTVGDSLRVTANNTCGSSIARALKINRNSPASTPGAITGSVYGVCNSSAVPYSVTSTAGVTYTWTWSVTNATIASGQGTNAVTANFAGTFVTGKISVTGTNACGTSSARSLTVYARPAVPAVINGSTGVCSGQQAVPYSIAPVSNASSYIWYAPSGSHISDGVTTSTSTSLATTATSVTVNFGSTAGQVRVKGVNSCAAGGVAATTVAFTCKGNDNLPIAKTNNSELMIYPNPSDGNFRITLNNDLKNAPANISIMNEFGQVVYQTTENTSNGMVNLKISDKLTNGIYMVSCTVNGVKTVKKLLINK
ncbi:MAG: zinc-dependent metalloprotease family protein [Ferruginibacter sp.]